MPYDEFAKYFKIGGRLSAAGKSQNLSAIRRHENIGRPGPVGVAFTNIRPNFAVDLNSDKVGIDQIDNFRVAESMLFHELAGSTALMTDV